MIPAPDEHDMAYDLAVGYDYWSDPTCDIRPPQNLYCAMIRRCHAAEERVKYLEVELRNMRAFVEDGMGLNGVIDQLNIIFDGDPPISRYVDLEEAIAKG